MTDNNYTPPFTVSAEAINKIAEISALIERYAIYLEQAENGLRLRKANRIKTIHSSLAIEGNTLTEDEVRDIVDGKTIVAPIRQIQEVKNAIKTYELYPTLNPFKEKDLLKDYEFEFIHPFSDGNGRTGRLWQSLILGRLHPIFEHLPVENMVYAKQQGYYDAISAATNAGQSGPFIDFMLSEIYDTLKSHQGNPLPGLDEEFGAKFGSEFGVKFGTKFGANQKKVLILLHDNPEISAAEIADKTGMTKRGVEKQIKKFRELGIITRNGSTKNGLWVVNNLED